MTNAYEDHLEVRNDIIDGEGPWIWIKGELGCWNGPKVDWEQQHKHNVIPLLRRADVAVQAGGACGMYPRLLSKIFRRVYTFEPDSLNFYTLCRNTQRPNIIKFNAALGNKNELVTVKRASMANVGEHKVEHLPWSEDPREVPNIVPTMMIDQLGLDACDLIMLDVEGAERSILEGAVETIKAFHPLITCENGTHNEIPLFLEQFGYRFAGSSAADSVFVYDR